MQELLAQEVPAPLPRAAALVRAGAAYVDGRRTTDPDRKLTEGQAVVVVLEERGVPSDQSGPAAAPLRVLFQDRALIAIDKPPGVNAQPTAARAGDSLLDLVHALLGAAPGLVHRLDRDTSGVTVFGKSKGATAALAAQFRQGAARKRYLAATVPLEQPLGEMAWRISKDPSRPGRYRASATANGVTALTRFERLSLQKDYALVALFPQTGRTHQLRAHLSALGAPILGDLLYGGPEHAGGMPAARCLLHAQALALRHPVTSEPLLLEAPLPSDLAVFFSRAGQLAPSGSFG